MKPYYKTDNCSLYQCDNLELLKEMPDNYIDLIYCDILYNTGRKLKDYDDNLGTSQEAIASVFSNEEKAKEYIKQASVTYGYYYIVSWEVK